MGITKEYSIEPPRPSKDPPRQDLNSTDPPPVTPVQAIQALAFLRIWHILGRKSNPPIEPLLPISRAGFYAGIKEGKYPAPVKQGNSRISLWRSEDIRKMLQSLGQEEA